jgi:hypothetical protein
VIDARTRDNCEVTVVCRNRTHVLRFLVAGLLVFLPAARTSAQTVVAEEGGLVRIAAHQVPLTVVLNELGQVTPLVLKVDPRVGERPVDATLESVSPLEALVTVLRSLNVDYAVSGGTPGVPIRVVVGNANAADEVAVTRSQLPAAKPGSLQTAPDESLSPEPASDGDYQTAVNADLSPSPEYPKELATPEFLLQLLSGPPRAPNRGLITLPIPGPDGKPLGFWNDAPPGDSIPLPFPGPDGSQMTIPRPSTPPDK